MVKPCLFICALVSLSSHLCCNGIGILDFGLTNLRNQRHLSGDASK